MLSEQPLDALPSSAHKVNNLAKRMGYPDSQRGQAGKALLADLESHRSRVRQLYELIFDRESSR
jgi:hypothetical protein